MYTEAEKKKVKIKNNIILEMTFNKHNNDEKYFKIDAFVKNDSGLKEIGNVYFSIKYDTAFLFKIIVTDKDYHSIGVGSAMLEYFENSCINRRVKYVEGKFYPEGYGAENARNFYLKHGYQIEKDGYETMIYKRLQELNKVR